MDTMEKVDVQLTTFDVQGTFIFALKVNRLSEIKLQSPSLVVETFFTYYTNRNVTVCEDVPHASKSISDIDYMAFDRISMTVRFLEERTQYRPKIAIICGSGLGMYKKEAS